jgi:hypothetical protein
MRFIPPPRHLSAHVLGVTVLRTDSDQIVATPAHALAIFTLVHRGALQGGAQLLAGPGALVGQGSARTARVVVATAGTVTASLLCRASILPLLSGESALHFADQYVPPVLAGLEADMLREHLAGDATDEALATALFAQVDRALRLARAPRTSALRFAGALQVWAQEQPSRAPVGWGERQWQRACQAELGVSPKFLQRLNRLHASVRCRMACRAEPLVQHAVDAGFFDQAHMAREYRLLTGMAPSQSLTHAGAGAGEATALGASQLAPRFFAR